MNQSENTLLETINETVLQPLVQQVLANPSVEIVKWNYEKLHGAGGGLGGTVIYRFSGLGQVQDKLIPWSLVLKILQARADESSSSHYWKREAEAYRSGWLNTLSGGLVTPRCYAIDDHPDFIRIWLEDVQDSFGSAWTLSHYGLVARHLGQFNGQYLAQEVIPTFSWFSSQWIRQDLATAAPSFEKMRSLLDHPIIRRFFPPPLGEKALRLWAEKERFLMVLEGLPQTVCHFDAFRRNLFGRSNADGKTQIVAIDWSYVGSGPPGAEIVALVWVTLFFRDVEASQARDLAGVVFANYLDGLRDSGWQGDPRQVRFAFT
ncbi:MAG: phosphotransferase, partial [Acidobacteria bacterium]|nr:phosphotransferase [Acidobacteriota bacterium]